MTRLRVASLADLPDGAGCQVMAGGLCLALFRVGGEVFALGDRCSHAEASLAEWLVSDGVVECPRHGSEFDLRTGTALTLPATRPAPVYRTEVAGGEVFVHTEEGQ
jgi:3-phenylpropionate/trans-cinnamate dioxygenase ferredoxin subunit